MPAMNLLAKRVLITNADVFMGPVLCKVFADHGATAIESTDSLLSPESPASIVAVAGQIDALVVNLAMPAPTTAVSEVLEALLKDKAALAKVLTYHVVSGKVVASGVKPGKVKAVERDSLTIEAKGGKVMVDKNVTRTDIAADNGVIHVIDTVLMLKM